jgi:PAS domain S-box-containing protein
VTMSSSSVRSAVSQVGDGWTALFDAATDVVAWVDRDGRYLYVNRAIETATGRPASDFIGHTNEETGALGAAAAVWATHLHEVIESGQPALFEFEFDTPEGRRRFQSTAAPISGADSAVESAVVISRDITDTRAQRLLEGAVHHLPTAVALVEAPTGHLLLRNARATDIFRVQSSPLSGISGYSRFVGFHPDGREYAAHEWPLSRSILTGEIVVGEVAEIRRGDGTQGFIRMTSAPMRDAEGTIIAGLVTFDDITEQASAERQQAFLASATALFGTSLEMAAVLQQLARLAVPSVTDWCLIHTVVDGRIELVALEHAESDRRAAAENMTARYPIHCDGDHAIQRVLRGGPSELHAPITDDVLRAVAADDAHLEYLRTVGCRSAIVVPIAGRGGVIGSLTFVTADSGRDYTGKDLAFAEDLGRRAGLALDNARLFEQERAARQVAERTADRLTRLHVFTAALAAAVTLEDVTAALVSEGRSAISAAVGCVWLLDDGGNTLTVSAMSGAGPAERVLEHFSRDESLPVMDAIRTGQPVIIESPEQRAARYPVVAQGTVQFASLAAIPLEFRGRPLGGFSFSFRHARTFDEADVAFLCGLAAQTSQAIDRARLFAAERDARADAQARAEELRIAEERLRLAVDAANVGLWNHDLDSDQLFWDPHIRQQFGLAADTRVTVADFYAMVHPDDRQGIEDAFVRAIERREMCDVEYRIGSAGAPKWIRSLARAAYRPGGRAYRIDGMTIDVTERKRIEDDHAALLQREQAARAETEAALKTRDDFLAAASHELRNPLNALQLQLVGLRRAAQRDPLSLATPAMTGRLDRTEEQITRLVRLVDTLLDVSRIKSGRLDIEYADVDLVAVAKSVVEQLEPMSDGVSIRLQAPGTLVGRWDPLRVEQILTNLLSNALKYGDGKPVDVAIWLDGESVRIAVTDRGIGIPADMLQRLFARFERLTPDHRRGGFGLGLWITRQIITAFGGTIDVRSELGKGSTFSAILPRQPRPGDVHTYDHASA